MKEFPTVIREFKGLRPNNRIPRNSPNIFEECYNIRIGKYGLEPMPTILQPYIGAPTFSFPFPQVIDTRDGTFLANSTTIYTVNSNYSLTIAYAGASGNYQWDIADFGLYQIWSNGESTMVRDYNRSFSSASLPFTISSLCNFRGQLVAGGFGGTKDNFVAWSEIGRIGTLSNLLTPSGTRNEAGVMPVPFGGSVLCVKEIHEGVVVYGTDGIALLYPAQQTFGLKVLSRIGILSKDSVCGDESVHTFVGSDGKVYRITTSKLRPEELDYSEYMNSMNIASIVLSYDAVEGDVYISDGVDGYLLTPNGMSAINMLVTSVYRLSGSLLGIRSVGADTTGYFVSTLFDLGLRAIKTITGIELGGQGTGMTAGLKYRFNHSGDFTLSTMKPVNTVGAVTPIVSGTDFKLKVVSTDYTTFSMDEVSIRWKMSDKRGIRGLYNVTNKNV